MKRFSALIVPYALLLGLAATSVMVPAVADEDGLDRDRDAVVDRVGREIEYLASGELEGRGVETEGIAIAAEYIREEFKKYGLISGVADGSYFQPFEVQLRDTVSKDKSLLVLNGPDDTTFTLEVGATFMPQRIGGDGGASGEIVFVGYGINAPDLEYQEYENIDVEGKIVLMLRHEPRQNDESSPFSGTDPSEFSYIMTKLTTAKLSQAAAVILVNDPLSTPTETADELVPADQFGNRSLGIPFAHVKQRVIEEVLGMTPLVDADGNHLASLEQVQEQLDTSMAPLSQPLTGWTAELRSTFETVSVTTSNVIGVIEGEGPLADETIVIGGHYDHLGYGGYGSRAPGRNEIHFGADDNATGTVAVLELARRFATAETKPRRRLVFIAFSGEERGLIGSRFYVENPPYPLENTVAMINFDMIGRLRNNSLTVFGAMTADEFLPIVEAAAEGTELDLSIPPSGFAGSDHLPFNGKQIPAVFLHTGLTEVYHTPEDSFETINVPGAGDVIDYSETLLNAIAEMSQRPTYSTGPERTPRPRRSYLGVEPDFDETDDGIYVRSVVDESPAAEAGLQVGDVIVKMGDADVNSSQDLAGFYGDNPPGTEVVLQVRRGDETLEVNVTLGSPPRRNRPRD